MLDIVGFLKPVFSMGRRAWNYLSRLFRERQAGRRISPTDESPLIDEEFDKTLARLRGEEGEDAFLSQIKTFIEHSLVTPPFLREEEIRYWLAAEQVRCDLKALASLRLRGVIEDDNEVKQRLIQAYGSSVSTKHKALAIEAIEVIVAILVTGYKTSLQGPTFPLAGLIQASFTENREELERVSQEISGVGEKLDRFGPDNFVVMAHTDQATKELDRILKRRGFRVDRVHDEVRLLARQIMEGDFRYADQKTKTKILYWAARLHTSDIQHILSAKNYLAKLHTLDSNHDTRIVDAYIMEREGNIEGALQLLRDINDPDGHSALLTVLIRTRGKEAALSWFEEQPEHEDAKFLTGLGWVNLAVSLAEMNKWEKAIDYLEGAQEHLEEWPDLAFVEGVFNAAMLLPAEMRHLALRMQIFHSQIQTVKGPNIDRRRIRAYECFDQAAKLMAAIGEGKRAELAIAWLLWLRLTNETEEIAGAAREEVREVMKDPAQAVNLLPVALAFGVDFDKDPFQRYLAQRRQMGGLDGQESFAEFLLVETTMSPHEYAEFLEREESRLVKNISLALIAGKRIEALLGDGQVARARHVLEAHKSDFVGYDYDRLRVMILKREGGDARISLEEIYSRTGELLDLQNLVREIEQAGDWTALTPLAEKLFQLERTKHNAGRLVECMRHDPQFGYCSILEFFAENPDVEDWGNDFRSAQAWAHFYLGQLKESRAINDQLLKARNNPADLQLDMNLAIQSGDWERFPAIVDREWSKRDKYNADLLLRLASLAAEADATACRTIELAKLAASKAPNDPSVLMNAYSLTVQLGRDQDADPSWMSRAAELSSDSGPVHRMDMRTLVQEMMPAHRERERLIERNLLRGEVPLHMAAAMLHIPLSRILIDLPRRNADQSDGRRRVIIPIASGARQIIGLQRSWVMGLDITSIMVLGFLDLLRNVLKAFDRIVLTPETMIVLLDERRRVRFHQPSRINNAEEIRELIDKDS